MKRGAFTLIELLIVIAIIAILALIAVPNFLEAQVRAKVSRAQGDMRSFATAVEAYAVDYNTIPLDADDRADYDMMNPACLFWWDQKRWSVILTTPIAYLQDIPIDPFNVIERPFNPMDMTSLLFPGKPPHPYAYLTQGAYAANPYRPSQQAHHGRPSQYGISSPGPNATFDLAAEQGINDIYDPTNGTVSRGDLIRRGGPAIQ